MVTISDETTGIEVSAETYAKAKRLLAKAVEAREEQSRINASNAAHAQAIAESHGFMILSRKASGKAFPRGWHYYDDDTTVNGFRVVNPDDAIAMCEFRQHSALGQHAGKLEVYPSDHLVAVVANSEGTLGAFICWGGQSIEFFAIGVYNGILRFVSVPGITTEDFRDNR